MTLISTAVKIAGKNCELSLQSLQLNQSALDHHYFTLNAALPHTDSWTVDKVKALLGEEVEISFSSKDHQGRFNGLITTVTTEWSGRGRRLCIKGASPGILMDVSPRFKTFSGVSLGQVQQQLFGRYRGQSLPKCECKGANEKLEFAIQHHTTDYDFLCELANKYQKVFCYDGERFYFGHLEGLSAQTIRLHAERDLLQAELTMSVAPRPSALQGFHLVSGDLLAEPAKGNCTNGHPVVRSAWSKSDLFDSAQLWTDYSLADSDDLKILSRQHQAGHAYDMATVHALSNHPGLKPGSKIAFEGADDLLEQGEYLITEVRHLIDPDQSYQNHFTAVPVGFDYPLRIPLPGRAACGPLKAVIKDINDPDKLGRVRVALIGEEGSGVSPWWPILTPFTSNGSALFPPEVGDHVLLLFEEFDTDKTPFVLGSFFHGKAKANNWNPGKRTFRWGNITVELEKDKLVIDAPELQFLFREMNIGDGKGTRLTLDAAQIFLKP